MRNLFFILVICSTVLAVTAAKSFSSDKAYTQKGIARTFSQNKVLNASEVAELFADKTMNVISEKTAKDTGTHVQYKAYFSDMGLILVVFGSGARETRMWSVKEDGALCIKRNMGRHTGGVTCGYIVPTGNGEYKMYKAKRVSTKKNRVIGGKQIRQLSTFSNFKKGNTL
ncbi:MAG: hypothetical protein JKY62_04505 [Desulfocapsa sp.]|nr:hypothetical protein [Desulfocapsa sp.]MBN4048938.1 hypothetical protein [bacterium AH-315-N22]